MLCVPAAAFRFMAFALVLTVGSSSVCILVPFWLGWMVVVLVSGFSSGLFASALACL